MATIHRKEPHRLGLEQVTGWTARNEIRAVDNNKNFEAASYEHDDHEDTKNEVGNNDDRHNSGNLH
jgi:hypothetical protein